MKHRILVVEDDAMFRELLGGWLENEGFEVVLADTQQHLRRHRELDELCVVILELAYPRLAPRVRVIAWAPNLFVDEFHGTFPVWA